MHTWSNTRRSSSPATWMMAKTRRHSHANRTNKSRGRALLGWYLSCHFFRASLMESARLVRRVGGVRCARSGVRSETLLAGMTDGRTDDAAPAWRWRLFPGRRRAAPVRQCYPICLLVYQISQRSAAFSAMLSRPALHPKALANGGKLTSAPFTRYLVGECGSVLMRFNASP